VYYLKTIL